MKILQIPDCTFSRSAGAAPTAPEPDLWRMQALDHITQSILQRVHAIEERINILEKRPTTPVSPKPEAPSPTSVTAVTGLRAPDLEPATPPAGVSRMTPQAAAVTMSTDALKKDLFSKMWKYLNDQAAA